MLLNTIFAKEQGNVQMRRCLYELGQARITVRNRIMSVLRYQGYTIDTMGTTVFVNGHRDTPDRVLGYREALEVFETLKFLKDVVKDFGHAKVPQYENAMNVDVVYDPAYDIISEYKRQRQSGTFRTLSASPLYPNGSVIPFTLNRVGVVAPLPDGGIDVCVLPDYITNHDDAARMLHTLLVAFKSGSCDNERQRERLSAHLNLAYWCEKNCYEMVAPDATTGEYTRRLYSYDQFRDYCGKIPQGETVVFNIQCGITRIGGVVVDPQRQPHDTVLEFTPNDELNQWDSDYSKFLEDENYWKTL
ncbi:TPA: hypothetical protein NGR52_004253 [Vibrio parahaemolyticus]|nr:hypothetical protein [Vibrio parahaemolyticus]